MSSSQRLTAVRLAQVISVPATGVVGGLIACMSYAGIPALMLAPADVAARQWRRIFDLGVALMPPSVVLIAAHFGFLAYRTSRIPGLFPRWSFDPTTPRALYATAAVLCVSIVPFTIIQMTPTNDLLKARAVSQAPPTPNDNARVHSLLAQWAQMNYVRAGLVSAGAVCAALATVLTA